MAIRNSGPREALKSVASALPYSQQIGEHSVITYEGDVTQTVQLHGLPFSTMDDAALNDRTSAWFATINSLGRTPGMALWSHVCRRRISYDQSHVEYDNPLSAELGRALAEKNAARALYVNELYLSPVCRMGATSLDRFGKRLLKREDLDAMRDEATQRVERASASLVADLLAYQPRRLGVYDREGTSCTAIGGLYSQLLNGRADRDVRLVRSELSYSLQSAHLHFGREVVEIQGVGGSRFAAVLGLVAPYTFEEVRSDALAPLLSASFEFVLSQSFTFLSYSEADSLLERQTKLLKSTTDNALLIKEVEGARKQLQAGRLAYGQHEFLLLVYGNSIGALNENLNAAESLLTQRQISTARVTGGALMAAYYSVLPANFKWGRIRAMPLSSDAFARLVPLHNHSNGNPRGSQWGMPVALLRNQANGPFFLNYHVSRDTLKEQGIGLEYQEDEEEGADVAASATGRRRNHVRDTGNYRIVGVTGGGKTTFKLALRLLARKKPAPGHRRLRTYSFDYLRGEEIAIRAEGGQYHRFTAGAPTGVAIFARPDVEAEHTFAFGIASWCAHFGGMYRMDPSDEKVLFNAVRSVFKLPLKARRFARLLDNITPRGENCLRASLSRWADGGPYAWITDSDTDAFHFETGHSFGFDVTEFLDIEAARTPILATLTHRISTEAAGSPHIIDFAEVWKVLKDPWMRNYIEEKALTVRRQGGLLGIDTQEPKHLTASGIGSTLLSQFPTGMVLPNSNATRGEYVDGLKLTPKEFELIKSTPEKQGYCLFKQGTQSTMVQLDLSGMSDMLAVLSTSQDNLEVLDHVLAEYGPDPALWLPEFHKRRV